MTPDKTPSEAELKALLPTKQLARDEEPKVQVWLTQKDAITFARAVLAKWGSPVVAGEPVAEMVPFHTPSGKRVAVISRFQHLPIGTKLYTHPSLPEGMAAGQALRKVLTAVQRYLPPGGPSAHDTLSEIIEVVDPWLLGQLDKS